MYNKVSRNTLSLIRFSRLVKNFQFLKTLRMKRSQGYKEEGYILLIETVHDRAKQILILPPGFLP